MQRAGLQKSKLPCSDISSQSENREVQLAKGNRIQVSIWEAGFAFSIIPAGDGWFSPQSAVNILCASRASTKVTSAPSPAQLPLPRLFWQTARSKPVDPVTPQNA